MNEKIPHSKSREFEELVKQASPEELEKWMRDSDEDVRQVVALYGNLSETQFTRLTVDDSSLVRCAIPVNEKVPEGVLALLIPDPEWEVRWNVASSNNATIGILQLLASDPHEVIREVVQKHMEYLTERN